MSARSDDDTVRINPNMPGWENKRKNSQDAAEKALELQNKGWTAQAVGRPRWSIFGKFGKKRQTIDWFVVVSGRASEEPNGSNTSL